MADQHHCAYTYTVQNGDSYFSIASKLNVDLNALLSANPNVPPSRLTVGDKLCVPDHSVNTPAGTDKPAERPENTPDNALPTPEVTPENTDQGACPANRRTVVQLDQTAEELQLKYGLSRYTLQQANPTVDLAMISAGDTLCIPEENVPCPVPQTYTLKADDTIETAAMALRVPVAALLRANPCLAPSDFAAGACIFVPQ